jgi:ribosome maturation factor RimP
MSEIVNRIEALVAPILSDMNVELVDLTYEKTHSGWTLCFYCDKLGGITLDDCSQLSGILGDLLDQNNVFDHPYSLEVSSPGLNRPLKKLKDFQNFIGELVDVKLYAPLEGQKNFHGVLLGANDTHIRLREDGRPEVELPRSQVAKANLNPDIKF